MKTSDFLAILIPILSAQFGMLYFLVARIDRAEARLGVRLDRLTEKVDAVDRRLLNIPI